MEKYALSHLKELYQRALAHDMISISGFYSEEEISEALSHLKGEFGKGLKEDSIHPIGGHRDPDRQRIVFSQEEEIDESIYIGAMMIETKNIAFTGFEHREVLGALLGLGIKRSLIGDIVIAPPKAYAYYAKEAEEMVLSLEKVGKENVKIRAMDISEVPEIATTEAKNVSIPSLRLDSLIAHVFLLSREQAKEAISKGFVKVGQEIMTKSDYAPKDGERISLKGHGKFRYIGENGTTKKGKLSVSVELYR